MEFSFVLRIYLVDICISREVIAIVKAT
jgi:hypothetical protein